MKLPFSQLPELPAGHGMVVAAPTGTGRTFFLSRLAQEGLEQGMKVCYLGYQDGNAWLWELAQAGHKELTFLDIVGAKLDVRLLDQLLAASLIADLLIIDNFDVMAYHATGGLENIINPSMTPQGFINQRLVRALRAVKESKTNAVFGMTVSRQGYKAPTVPENAGSWSWKSMHVIPVVHEYVFAGLDNLTVVRLVKELR